MWKKRQPLRRIMIRALITGFAAAALTGSTGCNTTEGIGKDVKSTGRGIEEAAQDAK